jgi:predicted ribosomally synthesized peptide with nif11-like leader
MSENHLNEFLIVVMADQALRSRITEPGANIVEIAREYGFKLDLDEASLSSLPFSEELDEQYLESVAGGGGLNAARPESNGVKMAYKLRPEESMMDLGAFC